MTAGKVFSAALAILIGLAAQVGAAQERTGRFEPKTLHVAAGAQAVCAAYARDMRAEYFAGLPGAPPPALVFTPAPMTRLEEAWNLSDASLAASRIDGDIDGDGVNDVVIARHRLNGGRGRAYIGELALTRLTGAQEQTLRKRAGAMAAQMERGAAMHVFADAVAAAGPTYTSPDESETDWGDPLEEPGDAARLQATLTNTAHMPETLAFVRAAGGRLYAVIEDPWGRRADIALYAFDRAMQPQPLCVFSSYEGASAALARLPPSAAPFLDYARETGRMVEAGRGLAVDVYWCEAPHGNFSGEWAHTRRNRALENAVNRPWSIGPRSLPHEPPITRENDWLYLWSLKSPWNRRTYESAGAVQPRAEQALAHHYVSAFGVSRPVAERWAHAAAEQLRPIAGNVNAYLNGLDPDNEAIRARNWSAIQDRGDALRLAAAARAPAGDLAKLLDARVPVDAGAESALFFALDDAAARSLLIARGANVNRPNPFGKTPLMLAAHFDNFAAAEALLRAGAAVNARTARAGKQLSPAGEEMNAACDIRIAFGRRTALMYAAENASEQLVTLLLGADADAGARDDQGRGVLDYLSRNETLSTATKVALRARLQSAGATSSEVIQDPPRLD